MHKAEHVTTFQAALFCTTPVDLIGLVSDPGRIVGTGPTSGVVPYMAFLSTTLGLAAFISAIIIVRFLDEAFSFLPDTRWHSPSRLILWSPFIFLSAGALSFIGGFAMVVSTRSTFLFVVFVLVIIFSALGAEVWVLGRSLNHSHRGIKSNATAH
jgi:hypothetical protein